MHHVIPKMLDACGCGVAAAILVAFGGLAPATRAVADVPPGTAGGAGRFPNPPRIAGPVHKPALAGDALIRKLGSNKLVFIPGRNGGHHRTCWNNNES